MSTTIASAKVRITADLTGLREDVRANVDEATAAASTSVNIGADTHAALEKIGYVEIKLDELDHRRVSATVDVDTSSISRASAGLGGLATTVVALGPSLIPVLGAVTAGGVGAAASLGSVALGVGVVALAAKDLKIEISTELSPVLADLRQEAVDGIMPGFKVLLTDLKPLIPPVEHLVADLAVTVGHLAAQAGKDLDSGGAAQFIRFLDKEAGPTLTTTVHVIENVVAGIAGLAEGSGPLVHDVGRGVLELSREFRDFGEGSGSSSGFHSFIDYVETEGPKVARTVGDIAGAAGHLIIALSPLGDLSLTGLDDLAKDIDRIPVHDLTLTAEGVAALVVGLKGMSVAKGAAAGLVEFAAPLGLAAPEALAVTVAVGGLSAALVEGYRKSAPFRTEVNALGRDLKGDLLPAFRATEQFVSSDLAPVLEGVGREALAGLTVAIHDVDGALRSNRPQLVQLGHAARDVGRIFVHDVLPVLGPAVKETLETTGREIEITIDVIGDLVTAIDDVVHVGKEIGHGLETGFHKAEDVVQTGVHDIKAGFSAFIDDAPTLLEHAGEEVVVGLGQGILDGIHKYLTGPVEKLGGFISSHLPGSPVKQGPLMVLNDGYAGKQIAKMVADGIEAGTPVTAAAAKALAKQIDAAMASASQYVTTTFADDLAGTPKQIRHGASELEYQLAGDDRRGLLSTSRRRTLDTEIGISARALVRLSGASDKVTSELGHATNALSNLRSEAASVRSSAAAGFTSLGDPSQFGAVTSGAGLLQVLGRQVNVGAGYAASLATLRHDHLNKQVYDQLVTDGPQDAGQAALLASLTPAQLAQFDKDEKALQQQGKTVGTASANYLFGKAIAEEKKTVDELRAERHQLHEDQTRLIHLVERLLTQQIRGSHRDSEALRKEVRRVGGDTGKALNSVARASRQKRRATVAGART